MLRARPPRLTLGPALRQVPLPLGKLTLSAVVHAVLVAFVIVTGHWWGTRPEKTYIVNLVPAVAAVGTPQGRTTVTPPPPPRVEEPPKREEPPPKVEEPPRPAPSTPVELPRREAVREMPTRPTAPREMPARDITPRVPLRPLESTPPPLTPAPPRPEQKELPSIASSTPARSLPLPAPPSTTPAPTRQAAAPPAPPLGQPGGSRQGTGAITLDVTDFPHAWYMREVQQKVGQKWDGRAREGQQPVAVFQIGRDGQISGLAIEKTSGNSVYDLAALRAITEASPFPPLPADFRGPWLRVHLGFGYTGTPG